MRAMCGTLLIATALSACPGLALAAGGKDKSGSTSAPASQPAKPKKIKIGEINKGMLGERVSVKAKVVRVIERPSRTREQITIVKLQEGDATIEVVYWADLAKQIPKEQKPAEGDMLRVVGKVTEYRGRLQITLEAAGDLRKLKPKKSKPSEGADRDEAKQGKGDDD